MTRQPSPTSYVGGGEPGIRVLAAVALSLVLSGCGSAKVSAQREVGTAPTTKPTVIYVADFDLDARDIKAETSLLPPPPAPPPGPLGGILPKPPGTPKEPAARRRELVDLMATSLVDELTKAGLAARRLSAGAPRPSRGWLVRGVFTRVDEGDRVGRSIVGFGEGQTQMQAVVTIDDLAGEVPKPFYEIDTTADSGKAPGAGPMVVFAPPVAAARFAISGQDLERNVKQAAAKIATDLAARVQK